LKGGEEMAGSGSVFTVSADIVSPIIETVTANAAILVPAGLGVTVLLIGVRMIPRLLKSLVKG